MSIIKNNTIDSVDNGNEVFGGYGSHSSFVKHADYFSAQPILISQEIARFFGYEGEA